MTISADRLAGQNPTVLVCDSAQVAHDSDGGHHATLPVNKLLGCRSILPAVRSYIDLRGLLLEQERDRERDCMSVLCNKELAARQAATCVSSTQSGRPTRRASPSNRKARSTST